MESKQNRSEEYAQVASLIKEKKEVLVRDNVMTINMNLSQKEFQCLEDIKIGNELGQFDYYEIADQKLENKLTEYFSNMGDNTSSDISTITQVIVRLVKAMTSEFETESAWTMVRVSLPNDDFSIPRWHQDGHYFFSDKTVYKLVATLKGPLTLFGETTDVDEYNRLIIMSSENYVKNRNDRKKFEQEDLQNRKDLMKVIKPLAIAKFGEAVIYLVGDKNAVIHSEPNITVPRIFISILPGSRSQIEEWKSRSRGDPSRSM